ncbi:unnamed protein product [Rotaria sp. Silwood1]|nr:unnamed protein product [Rotaria sp. Silwood1]
MKEKSSFAYQKTVRDFYSSLKPSPIPRKIKFSATEACTEFCALDARAFDVVKGDGFKNLAKTLFGVGRGTNTSSIEITDLLPHLTTISTNITRLYEEYKIQLIDICEQLTSFCLIVDQWTEAHTGISYCGIALQYVGEYSQLFTFIIGCFPYNAASHSAQHLREFVNKILEEYKLQLDSTKFVVTDNEPKMLPAFREQCSRVGCVDHYLNKQLQHAFQSDQIHLNKNTIEKVDCELVQNSFNQVKKVVSSVRHSHQQQQFSQKFQTYSETRFGDTIIMLDIFREVFFELPEVLINRKTLNDYNLIEKELLDDICNYLEPFQEILDAVSEDQQPSLHRVIPLRQYLMNKCEVKEDDSAAIIRLEVFLACRIKNAWHITDHHRLSTILHPKLKNFDCCIDEKEKSINVLKQEFEKHKLIDSSSCTNTLHLTQSNVQSSSPASNQAHIKKSMIFSC